LTVDGRIDREYDAKSDSTLEPRRHTLTYMVKK